MSKTTKRKVAQSIINDPNTNVVVQQQNSTTIIPLSFPSIAIQARKIERDNELLQTFSKVEINILFLDVIRQIPKYAKFLKELCINKGKKLKGDVEVGKNVSALIKSEQVSALIHLAMPKKCNASINVIPSSVYRFLRLGGLEPTDMKDELSSKGPTLILGRSFLKTVKTKIDVHVGTLSMEFKVEHTIFEAIKTSRKEPFIVQPPLPSIMQPLQSSVITGNKIQIEEKDMLLQDLKNLGDFYKHPIKVYSIASEAREYVALTIYNFTQRAKPSKKEGKRQMGEEKLRREDKRRLIRVT
ncbi:hypothetical protein CR513_53640, partial [Mucuna pruriens]